MNNMEQSKTNKTNTEEIKQKTPEPQESKKEISVESIDEALITEEGILDSLNKYSKDEFFKDIDLKNNLKFKGVGVVDEKLDKAVYGKATLSEKILNFATLGLAKKNLGFIKSKERGLLNKDVFNKEMEGKEIEIGQNTEERSGMEKIIGNMHKELSEEDLEGRRITKSFEFVDGKIIKIVQASRTEQGMIDAAGKLLNGKIGTLEKGAGADLIKEKEGLEKHYSSKEKIAEMTKYLDPEAKEEIIKKISQEEADSQERIKEKEENLKSELDVFRTPFQERLGKTNELIDNFSGMLKDTKEAESKYNSQLKNINSMIEQAQKSGLFEGSKKEVVERLNSKKAEFEEKAKEFGVRKNIFEAKLGQLKNNKTELEKVVSKINGIGKTKKEITEEKKAKTETNYTAEEKENPEIVKKIDLLPEGDAKEYFKKLPTKSRRILVSDESFMEDDVERINAYYEHLLGKDTKIFGPGLKNEKINAYIAKTREGKQSDIHLPKKEDVNDEQHEDISEKIFTDKVKNLGFADEFESKTEKTFTEKEIEDIVKTHLKIVGLSKIKDRKIQDQITINAIGNVKKMIAKNEEPMTDIYIRKETKRVFDALSASYFKSKKQL